MRGLEISPEKSLTRKNAQTFCHKNSMDLGCADSPKLNLSDFINYSPQKIYCSYFNALSIMKAFSLTLLTGHDSAQLNRLNTEGFLFPSAEKNIYHFHLISLPGLKMIAANLKSIPVKASWPLVFNLVLMLRVSKIL